jgi:L-rhamnose mutarotase
MAPVDVPEVRRPAGDINNDEPADMRRYCFLLQVHPELLDEYRARHANVWPEMLTALRAAGWHRYSLFLRDDGLLVGYVETSDLAEAQAAMAATDVNARWQAEMSRFFAGLGGRRPDEGLLVLEEVFNLEDQLLNQQDPPVEGRTET